MQKYEICILSGVNRLMNIGNKITGFKGFKIHLRNNSSEDLWINEKCFYKY